MKLIIEKQVKVNEIYQSDGEVVVTLDVKDGNLLVTFVDTVFKDRYVIPISAMKGISSCLPHDNTTIALKRKWVDDRTD